MSNLVLDLRPGEMMIVNGASIRFQTRSRIELTTKARFLFGKQIMAPDQACSPARRIYFALQTAYIGAESERETGLEAARVFIADLHLVTTSEVVMSMLDQALAAAEEDNYYSALKAIRQVIQHEDAILNPAQSIVPTPEQPDQTHDRELDAA
jgi:flagellar protein FlbT